MPTFYGNTHFNTGHRERRNGRWVRIFMGNDSGSSACSYSHRRWYLESAIIGIDDRGICRSGGRAKRIRMRNSLADEEITGFEEVSKEELESIKELPELPDNIKALPMGNGHIIWVESEPGVAGSVAFVPAEEE